MILDLLLVDDNDGDRDLVRIALRKDRPQGDVRLHEAADGDEALAYLRGAASRADAVPPNLILLDLNMPGKGGLQVLLEIRSDERLRRIPVVILTSSDDERDVLRSRELGAAGYVRKPISMSEYRKVLGGLVDDWIGRYQRFGL